MVQHLSELCTVNVESGDQDTMVTQVGVRTARQGHGKSDAQKGGTNHIKLTMVRSKGTVEKNRRYELFKGRCNFVVQCL